MSDLFHKITAQVLCWVGKKGRPNLQLGMVCLCTRAKAPVQHDYKKLKHLTMNLQTTSFFPLILKLDRKGTSLYIGEMIADYFIKPLGRSLFRKFRNMILGIR